MENNITVSFGDVRKRFLKIQNIMEIGNSLFEKIKESCFHNKVVVADLGIYTKVDHFYCLSCGFSGQNPEWHSSIKKENICLITQDQWDEYIKPFVGSKKLLTIEEIKKLPF